MVTKLFRRILVPHDLSDHATRALEVALDLAAQHRGRVTVLHAVTPAYTAVGFPPESEIVWTPRPDAIKELQGRLEAIVKRARKGRRVAVACRVEIGYPLEAIVNAAHRADLIVIATLGRTGVSHLLIGSIAEKVVRHAPVPVLTIRPRTRARAVKRTRRARRR